MAYERSLRTRFMARIEELGCTVEETKPVHVWGQPGVILITAPAGRTLAATGEGSISVEHGSSIGVSKEDAYAEALRRLEDGLVPEGGVQNPPIRAKRFVEFLEARRGELQAALDGLGPKDKGMRIETRARIAEVEVLMRRVRTEFIYVEASE